MRSRGRLTCKRVSANPALLTKFRFEIVKRGIMDQIRIHGLLLDCIVGIHAHERVTEQPLRVDLGLWLDTREAARTGRIAHTIHYGDVAEQVRTMLRFRRYRLLESAAEEVAVMLLGVHPRLSRVSLRLEKPRALAHLAEAASLEIERTHADLAPAAGISSGTAGQSGVHLMPLLSTREAELSVATIEPHQQWPGLHGNQRRCLTWVLQGELHGERLRLTAGQWHVCEPSEHIEWSNVSEQSTRVFRCEAWSEASLTAT